MPPRDFQRDSFSSTDDMTGRLSPLTTDSRRIVWEHWMRVAHRMARAAIGGNSFRDAAQSALLLLWIKVCREPVDYPPLYLACCIKKLLLQLLRTRTVAERNADSLVAIVEGISTPEDRLLAREKFDILEVAMDGLPEAQREFVVKHYYDQLTAKEIAEVMSIPLGSVKRRLSAAMGNLRSNKTLASVS
jgi:RNA polymerase sigma factor (sigma-70 family)